MEKHEKLAEHTGQLTLRPLELDEAGWEGINEDGEHTSIETTHSFMFETLLKQEEFHLREVKCLMTISSELNRDMLGDEEMQVALWAGPALLDGWELDGDENRPAEYQGDIEQIIGIRGNMYRSRMQTLDLLKEWSLIK